LISGTVTDLKNYRKVKKGRDINILMTEPDYCPHLNQCGESRRDICYNHREYQNCSFYEANNTIIKMRQEQKRVKGLTKKVE
jgi:hypothetical protein